MKTGNKTMADFFIIRLQLFFYPVYNIEFGWVILGGLIMFKSKSFWVFFLLIIAFGSPGLVLFILIKSPLIYPAFVIIGVWYLT
jgi:hypothetical protein